MRYFRYTIVFAIILLCFQVSYAEGEIGKPGGIKQIKPPIPNISAEYKDLEKVFNQYWDFMKKKEFEKAYEMESAEYRKANPYKKETYEKMTGSNIKVQNVTALEVTKINEKEVVIKANLYFVSGQFKSVRQFQDKWLKGDTQWVHMPGKGIFGDK